MGKRSSQSALIIMPLAEQRGGAELALLHLLEHGRRDGITWVVAFLENGPMVTRARELGVEAHVVPAGRLRQVGRYLAAVWTLAKLAREYRVGLLLGWMGKAQLYGGPAARLAGVPALWFQHGLPRGGWLDRLATRIPAAGVLTCSQFVADAQAKLRPVRPTQVVHPGAELERFDPRRLPSVEEAKRRAGLDAERPVVGMVGRLQSWKGMHVLIEAMPDVLRRHPEAACLIVGGQHAREAEYAQQLHCQVERLGIRRQVIFAGHQSNVPEWMQAMDVIVHASDCEPFGMVVIEAMSLGKPVIATVPGGPAEVICDPLDGQLVPFGDAGALAAAVTRYLDDPGFAAACGRSARERAGDFSADAFARRTCDAVGLVTDASRTEAGLAIRHAAQNAS